MVDLFQYIEFRKISVEGQRKAQNMLDEGVSINEILKFCRDFENKEKAADLKKAANLSKKFSLCTFDRFNPYTAELKNAYSKALRYAKSLDEIINEGLNLIFEGHGCVGTGKTHLAYSIANYALENGVPTIAVNISQLVNALNYDNKNSGFICNFLVN